MAAINPVFSLVSAIKCVATGLKSWSVAKSNRTAAKLALATECVCGLMLSVILFVTLFMGVITVPAITALVLLLLFMVSELFTTVISAQTLTLATEPSRVQGRAREGLRLVAYLIALTAVVLPIVMSQISNRGAMPQCVLKSKGDTSRLGSVLSTAFIVVLYIQLGAISKMRAIRASKRFAWGVGLLMLNVLLVAVMLVSTWSYARIASHGYRGEKFRSTTRNCGAACEFNNALHFGDYCTSLFVVIGMFLLVAAVLVSALSANRLSLYSVDGELSAQHALFAETMAIATIPVIGVMAIGRMFAPNVAKILAIGLLQLNGIALPYVADYALSKSSPSEEMATLMVSASNEI